MAKAKAKAKPKPDERRKTTSEVFLDPNLKYTEKAARFLDRYGEMLMSMKWLDELSRNRKELAEKGDMSGRDAFFLKHDFAHLGARIINLVRELETGQKPTGIFFNPLFDNAEGLVTEIQKEERKDWHSSDELNSALDWSEV